MSDDLISRRALYEKAATLEAQALDYVGKLIERDGDGTSVEWKIWSAILTERTAFKHDVYDAPYAQPDIKQAAKLLSDFIESCPGGMSYLITPNGEELRTDWGYASEGIQLIYDWAERRTDG